MATTNADKTSKMTRTVREITDSQRDSYHALTQNLAAAQERGVRLTRDGMEFLRLQEQTAKATEQWLVASVKVAQLQQRNVRFAQDWLRDGAGALREQTEHNLLAAEAFARGASRQQEGFRALARSWADAYRDFLSPFAYFQESLRTTRQAAQQGLEATEQVAQQGLRIAGKATEQTDMVLRQTEQAAREVEREATVFAALQTADYEGLTVDEISRRLDGLSVQQLEQVREYEKQNKNRETFIERIDRKIRVNS